MKKYFVIIGALLNTGIIFAIIFVFQYIYSSGLSLPLFSDKVKESLMVNQSNLYKIVAPALSALSYFEVKNHYFRQVDLAHWVGIGANKNDSNKQNSNKINFSSVNKNIEVHNTPELIFALKTAQAGQTIIISPGEYHLTSNRITIGQSGTAVMPIHMTAQKLGTVTIFLKGEGIVVNKPFWQFSNLHFIGNCKSHTQCEHAFHIVGKAQYTVIKNNIMQDFNAMIKVNGVGDNYPDYGKVIQNTFFNTTARKTANPVTPFDLMHANYWQVSDNFIFDIQKSAGNKVSYAAFFKGGSEYGVFERNLIICAANLPDKYTALGLSLGGGGSAKRHRRNQNSAEHVGGIIRNNIIMHCSNDVGIYLNRARDSLIEHNILYNTLGIDIRYPESDAKVSNNILSGRIKIRDNAKLIKRNNIVVSRNFITGEDNLSDYFVAPDIGDFTWGSTPDTHVAINSTGSIAFDFCGATPNNQYIGAYSAISFCLDKLNINNKINGE